METKADNRLRALAAIALLREGAKARLLADHLGEAEGAPFSELAQRLAKKEDLAQEMALLLQKMAASERFSTLAEVHPAWMLERLKEETPRVVGIILRSLPSRHVRYLLEHMPPPMKQALPNMVESFSVEAPILEVVRQRFERHFLSMRMPHQAGAIAFEQLYYLRTEELEALIRDLGLTELAIALALFTGRALRAVCHRLDLKDAKRLQKRIHEVEEVSPRLAREARSAILAVEEDRLGPDRMLLRIGLASLASAVGEEGDLLRLTMQRLEPATAYLLKRFVEERRGRHESALVAERRALVLVHVERLSREGGIDPSWASLFSSEEHLPSQAPHPSPALEEETRTDQQLA